MLWGRYLVSAFLLSETNSVWNEGACAWTRLVQECRIHAAREGEQLGCMDVLETAHKLGGCMVHMGKPVLRIS